MEDAVQTVMTQCELWTDNNDMDTGEPLDKSNIIYFSQQESSMVVDKSVHYDKNDTKE